jgi:hypothetical protein
MESVATYQVPGSAIPVPYLIIDVETTNPDPSEIELEASYLKASGNCASDESKGRSLKKKVDSLQERAALTDLAPIACIAVKSPGNPIIFSQFPLNPEEQAAFTAQHIECVQMENEKAMLSIFREFLGRQADDLTVLAGYNIGGFDLKKLRFRYIYHRLKIPDVLQTGNVFDLMTVVNNQLTIKHEWLSLDEIVTKLKLSEGGKLLSGADVPGLLAAREYAKVFAYCVCDVLLAEQLYLLLNGNLCN